MKGKVFWVTFNALVAILFGLGCVQVPSPAIEGEGPVSKTAAPSVPSITNLTNRVFPLGNANNPILQGETYVIDAPTFSDFTGGVLKSGSWTCTVRTVGLDLFDPNFLVGGTSCDALVSLSVSNFTTVIGVIGDDSTTAGFDENTGVLTWTPTRNQRGTYEFTLQALNTVGLVAEEVFYLTVRENYAVGTELIFAVDAQFSVGDNNSLGELPFIPRDDGTTLDETTTNWTELFGGTIAFSEFYASNPWSGTGQTSVGALSPYALDFNGQFDVVDSSDPVGFSTRLGISVWVKPASVTTSGSVFVGNGGGSGNGFLLGQSKGDPDQVEFIIGTKDYNTQVLALAPIAHWRMGDVGGDSGTFADSSGATNCGGLACNGKYASAPSTPTARQSGGIAFDADNSVLFDGANDFIELNNTMNTALDKASFISISAWINNASLPALNTSENWIFGSRINGANAGFEVHMVDAAGVDSIRVSARSDVADPLQSVDATFTASNTWSHIVGVIDYPNDLISIYINGALANAGGVAFLNSEFTRGNPTQSDTIGASPGRAIPEFFNGFIDDVSIFDQALTAAQVQTLYQAGAGCRLPVNLENDRWYHISGTYDQTNTNVFINGRQGCSVADGAVLSSGDTSVSLGGALATASFPFNGSIADVKLYGTVDGTDALADTTINSDFLATANRFREVPIEDIHESNLIIHFDAANANRGTTRYSGCNSSDLTWYNVTTQTIDGTLNNFDTCGTFGWQGTGEASAPFTLTFEGDNDFVDMGDLAVVDGATELTAEFWVKVDDLTADGVILSKGTLAGNEAFLFFRDETAATSGNTDTFSAQVSDGVTDALLEAATNSSSDNNYHHIAVVFKANDLEGLRLFIDGVENASSPVSTIGILSLENNANSLLLGAPTTTAASELDGEISVFRLYNSALTVQEIKQNCLAQELRYSSVPQGICTAP